MAESPVTPRYGRLLAEAASQPRPLRPSIPRLQIGINPDIQSVANANTHLLNNEPLKALQLYTTNLVDHNPGNPCAFLNRSLCYLALGYPELAVMDAHRARLALDVASSATFADDTNKEMLRKLGRFATWTTQADNKAYPWIRVPAQNYKMRRHMDDLLMVPLAALTIGSRLDPSTDPSVTKVQDSLFNDTKMKAMYRIAYSLWKCGNGALMDALDIIEQAMPMCHSGDQKQFLDLGNRIMLDIEKLKKKESLYTRLRDIDPEDITRSEGQRQLVVEKLLATRFTTIRRQAYPWDSTSDLKDESNQDVLEAFQATGPPESPKCVLKLIEDENGNSKPAIFAQRPSTTGQKTLSEYSPFHVVSGERGAYSYCDACAARMSVPPELARHLKASKVDAAQSSSTRVAKSETSTAASDPRTILGILTEPVPEIPPSPRLQHIDYPLTAFRRSPSRELAQIPTSSSQGRSSFAVHSSLSNVSNPSKDVQFCKDYHHATNCSRACLQSSNKAFGGPLQQLDLEDWIRKHSTLPCEHPDTPQPQFEILCQLMLVKVLANAITSEEHPLRILWMLGTDSGLAKADNIAYNEGIPDRDALVQFVAYRELQKQNKAYDIDEDALLHAVADEMHASKPKADTMPWSYQSHVQNPLTYLCRLLDDDIDAMLDIGHFDGWILNTVMAKIQHGMRVEKPQWHKEYDEEGRLEDVSLIPEAEREEEQVWVGSLQPMAYTV